MQHIKINTWNEYNYSISNGLITKYKLLRALVEFRKNVLNIMLENNSLIFQLKVKMGTGEYRSISKCYLIKVNELVEILDELLINLEIRMDAYNQIECSSFIISYKIFDKEIINKKIPKTINYINRLPSIVIGGYNLPSTMDLYEWGDVHFFTRR